MPSDELPAELAARTERFLVELVKLLVDEPVEVLVRVQSETDPDGALRYRFYVRVPRRWIGFLVGPDKGGTASAIRRLLRSYVARHGCQAYVDARIQRHALED
jgi:predicted RNA-binding protein YlqC (UPF0109 family)